MPTDLTFPPERRVHISALRTGFIVHVVGAGLQLIEEYPGHPSLPYSVLRIGDHSRPIIELRPLTPLNRSRDLHYVLTDSEPLPHGFQLVTSTIAATYDRFAGAVKSLSQELTAAGITGAHRNVNQVATHLMRWFLGDDTLDGPQPTDFADVPLLPAPLFNNIARRARKYAVMALVETPHAARPPIIGPVVAQRLNPTPIEQLNGRIAVTVKRMSYTVGLPSLTDV